jgi:hypothetical protein
MTCSKPIQKDEFIIKTCDKFNNVYNVDVDNNLYLNGHQLQEPHNLHFKH